MTTDAQRFFSTSSLRSFNHEDVLADRVVKVNPALITIIDGHILTTPPEELQRRVESGVIELLACGVRTFHLDINFPDYGGFGAASPGTNTGVFTPDFLARLNDLVHSHDAYLNLHLLTDNPRERLRAFAHIPFGAVCFQLDTISDRQELNAMIDAVLKMGACASPVIETVGSGATAPAEPNAVLNLLRPALPQVGMLTFQAAATASRSNTSQGAFTSNTAKSYIDVLRSEFQGTVQVQGGITTRTIGEVVQLGVEFLVCGTEIFRNPEGRSPAAVIAGMLAAAARALEQS